ncbi:MAG: transposase [bacterium]|nr:hypothetical protein [Gammaproteobacteria bacterium]HIL94561.1 hypothetical protein [Pseudomonadales bacterium]
MGKTQVFPPDLPQASLLFGRPHSPNRDRYQSGSEVQKYTGIAPVIESSAKKSWTHWRYACAKFLRQSFVERAGQTVSYSFWARVYYKQQKSKSLNNQASNVTGNLSVDQSSRLF